MTDALPTRPHQALIADNTGQIALCLSGGGFRATFFHLGVVRLLSKSQLLRQVTSVFAVSGGSILAAHMARRWHDYTANDVNKLNDATTELVNFGLWDLRGRITRRYCLGQSRIKNLERYYREKITDNYRLDTPRCGVRFHILATSLNTGRLCSFTFGGKRSQIVRIAEEDYRQNEFIPADSFPLAKAVAASSAFPPLFPPVLLSKSGFPDLEDREFRKVGPDYLTDGGVFDNPGVSQIDKLLDVERKEKFNLIIVSDASGVFDSKERTRYNLLLSRSLRTTDILMYRLATVESKLLRGNSEAYVVVFPIRKVVEPIDIEEPVESSDDTPSAEVPSKPLVFHRFEPQAPTVQRLCRMVRTDLDEFDAKIFAGLMNHGYEVAVDTMVHRGQGLKREISDRWRLSYRRLPNISDLDLEDALRDARRRRIRFWNWKDPIWLWLFCAILGIVVALVLAARLFPDMWLEVEQAVRELLTEAAPPGATQH